MGTVTDLDPRRDDRHARFAALAARASLHPALRWWAGDDRTAGHRRTPTGRAVCGEPGELLVADHGTPRCAACYQDRAAS